MEAVDVVEHQGHNHDENDEEEIHAALPVLATVEAVPGRPLRLVAVARTVRARPQYPGREPPPGGVFIGALERANRVYRDFVLSLAA